MLGCEENESFWYLKIKTLIQAILLDPLFLATHSTFRIIDTQSARSSRSLDEAYCTELCNAVHTQGQFSVKEPPPTTHNNDHPSPP